MTVYYVDGALGSDSNAGTSAGSGNAWATIAHALATIAAGDLVYVKASATYSISSALTSSASTYTNKTRIVGYTSTPGDCGRATISQTAAAKGFDLGSLNGWSIENFVLDGTSTGTQGVSLGNYSEAVNCVITNWTAEGFIATGDSGGLWQSEVTSCGGTNGAVIPNAYSTIFGCSIHDNSVTGIYVVGVYKIISCKIYNNSGYGIYNIASAAPCIIGCTIHNNSSDGIRTDYYQICNGVFNNILTSNGGYGLKLTNNSAAIVDVSFDYNWFGTGGLANTSGARNNILAGPHDLSGDPQYVNAGAGDFTPQNAAVQAGFP